MEGKKKGYSARYKRHVRGMILFALLLLVLISGLVKANLTEAKVQKAQKINSRDVKVENAGCDSMELNPLQQEKYPEVTEVVQRYYRSLGEKSSFADSYDDIIVYTKLGKYKDTYVAFVRYDMKIKDIYTKVPGLGTVYVAKDAESEYQVSASPEDEEINAFIQEIAQHEDVQALLEETQTAYHEAVQSDALLQEALTDLKNAYEDSTGS